MTFRTIVRYPDPRLRQPAGPVVAFDAELRALAGDLSQTLRAVSGIGITAPHVGVPLRLVVLHMPGESTPRIYANPRIVRASDELRRQTEGSISMPGLTEEVERPARVRVAYQDLEGNEAEEEADGLLAACHQHEIDQLDGIFWLERLSRLRRDRTIKRYQKLKRTG